MTDWAHEKAKTIIGRYFGEHGDVESLDEMIAQALRDERKRCELIIAGWSTAENHLPPISNRTSGWLAERDLEIAAAIRDSDG